jgi:diguanylate cyclase (GGDEF)-like protein
MHIREIRYQFRQNFQLAVITLMGTVALLGMSPFAVYRLLRGDWLAGILEAVVISSMVLSVVYAWRTGNCRGPGIVIMYIGFAGQIALNMIVGQIALFWMYPLIVSSFFLVQRRHAFLAMIVLLAISLVDGRAFPSMLISMAFSVTVILICCYTYIFAAQAEAQRQQLEHLASRDTLTGAFNRRTFQQELLRAHQAFTRQKTICGLLVLDIDHFKQVNDTWGHDAGDEVLMHLATLIENSVRKIDRFFRYGGEEFVLLVYPTCLNALKTMAHHVCCEVEQKLSYQGRTITVSIGGALLQPEESPDAWFARADAALYRAKHQGRNRAVIDVGEQATSPPLASHAPA